MEQECLLALQQDQPLHLQWQPARAAVLLMLSGSGQLAVQRRQWHLPGVHHLGRPPMPLARPLLRVRWAGRERQEAARQLRRVLHPLAQLLKPPPAADLPDVALRPLCHPLRPPRRGHRLHR